MKYRFVSRLPKDACCTEHYEFPFKFGKNFLYVYEPGIIFDCPGWYRRVHRLDCYLANYLKGFDFYSANL